MKKEKTEFVLNINKLNGYCTNIRHSKIEPLYNYFRRRIGSHRFPMSDKQRHCFDKLIINLCTERYIYVEHWVLYNYFNIYNCPQWQESRTDTIETNSEPIIYKEVKEEMKLICKLIKAKRIGVEITLSLDENVIFERISQVDEYLVRSLSNNVLKEA